MRIYKNARILSRPGMIAGLLAALAIGGYTLYAALPYLLGPSLSASVTNANGETYVSGKAARVSFLAINGAAIPLQEDGAFSAKRAYPTGYTAVTISAKDRFGRSVAKTITFLNK